MRFVAKRSLALRFSHCYGLQMENVTPHQIEQAALDARLPMTELFRRSGVSASTFYRARAGKQMLRPLTAAKLLDAIKDNAE